MENNQITISGDARQRGITAVNLLVDSKSLDALAKALSEQVTLLANASLEKHKHVSVDRNEQGAITGSTVKETSQINERMDTLAGMISALLGWIDLYQKQSKP